MRQNRPLVLSLGDKDSQLFSFIKKEPEQALAQGVLIYKKQITAASHWQTSLILSLLKDLNESPLFLGAALLEDLNEQNLKFATNISTLSSTLTCNTIQELASTKIISYNIQLFLGDLSYQEMRNRDDINFFINLCESVHELIEAVMKRYQLKNKTSFWNGKFVIELNKIMNKKTEQSENLWKNVGVKEEGKREDPTSSHIDIFNVYQSCLQSLVSLLIVNPFNTPQFVRLQRTTSDEL